MTKQLAIFGDLGEVAQVELREHVRQVDSERNGHGLAGVGHVAELMRCVNNVEAISLSIDANFDCVSVENLSAPLGMHTTTEGSDELERLFKYNRRAVSAMLIVTEAVSSRRIGDLPS
jgi:hypothetical protein